VAGSAAPCIHTFSGNVGFMLARGVMIGLAALLGWRGALTAAGVLAFLVLGAMLIWSDLLREEAKRARARPGEAPPGRRWAAPPLGPVLLLFLFYVLMAMFTSGNQVVNLLKLADALGLVEEVRSGFHKIVVASIGPTTSEMLRNEDLPVDLEPSHPKMGHLVHETAEASERDGGDGALGASCHLEDIAVGLAPAGRGSDRGLLAG
jgi:hypothetical protein